MSALSIAFAVLRLAPEIRVAVSELVKGLQDEDPAAARKALEAALRLQFIARQRLVGRKKS